MTSSDIISALLMIVIVVVATHEVRSQIRHAESMAHFHALNHSVEVGCHAFDSHSLESLWHFVDVDLEPDFEPPIDSRLVRIKGASLASQLTNAQQMQSVLGFAPTPLQQRELRRVAVGLADHAVLLTTGAFGIVELIVITE